MVEFRQQPCLGACEFPQSGGSAVPIGIIPPRPCDQTSFDLHVFHSGEGELLFAPLTNLERMGNPWVKMHKDKPVVVVSVKVNSNQKSLRIEEILSSRKKTLLALADNAANGIKFDMQLLSNAPFDELEFKKQFGDIEAESVEWFNADQNFKRALDKVLEPERKYDAIQKFVKQELKVRMVAAQICKQPTLDKITVIRECIRL